MNNTQKHIMRIAIACYIAVEIFFQQQLHGLLYNHDSFQTIEWLSRIVFTCSCTLFLAHLTQKAQHLLAAAALAFSFSFALPNIVISVLTTEQQQTAAFNVMAAHDHMPLNKALVMAFDGDRQAGQDMFDEQINAAYKAKEVIVQAFNAYKVADMVAHGEKPERAMEAIRLRATKRYYDNMFYVPEIRKAIDDINVHISGAPRYPIGSLIRIEADKDTFHEAMTEYLTSQDNFRDLIKIAVMLPIGFIFSTIGIIVNTIMLIGMHIPKQRQKVFYATSSILVMTVFAFMGMIPFVTTFAGFLHA